MVFINLQGAQIRFSRTPPTGSADEPLFLPLLLP